MIPPSNTELAIQFDIDPAITAGFIHDRYDLLIRGRAVAPAALEEVAMTLDGALIGRVQYGEKDHVQISGETDRQHAFHINLPLSRSRVHRQCTCVLTARTVDGREGHQSFELAVDPSGAMPVAVISGPTRLSSSYAQLRPPVVLYVERAALDDTGRLLVIGWAVSLTPMSEVQAFVADTQIGTTQPGRRRSDVGDVYPLYTNSRRSGFSMAAQAIAPVDEIATLRVRAVNQEGLSHEVVLPVERVSSLALPGVTPPLAILQPSASVVTPTQSGYRLATEFKIERELPSLHSELMPASADPTAPSSTDPRREIRLFCDEFEIDPGGHLEVVGWAVCAIGVSKVSVHLDSEMLGEAELGIPRQDVGDEYRHIPMARYSGFHFARELGSISAGEHRIRIVVHNGLDDVRELHRIIVVETPAAGTQIPNQFRLEIDHPTIVSGIVVDPVTGRLTIEGWALARSGVTGIDVLVDDTKLGAAHYGMARQDVGAAFPEWTDSLRSGFAFHCPPRSLQNGDHVVQLNVRARSGELLEYRFNITVRKSEEFDEGLTIRRRITRVEADVLHDVLDDLGHRPGFRMILCQNSTLDIELLLPTLESLHAQLYRDWQLLILTKDAATCTAIGVLIKEAAQDLTERLTVIDPSHPTFNDPLGSEAGTIPQLIGFIGAGDQLGCDALMQVAVANDLHREVDVLYADEARTSPVSREREPFFKPDFSPDLLLSTNYIGRPWFVSAALAGRLGLTARELLEAGEYDSILRCTELAARIHHVPKLLCLRGKEQIDDAGVEAAALARAMKRRSIAAEILPGTVSGTWRVRRTQMVEGKVSIIIPTCAARGHIETCIESLRERTSYRNIEIVCIDNIPDAEVTWKQWLQQHADKVVPAPDTFNWSRFNNLGVAASSGEYLLFLNDDTEVTQPDWLDVMLEHIDRPEVAVVGPQLLYPDNKVQHAGMFLATPGVARHAFRFAAADDPGYFGLALTLRNVIAVTGACMLMRRSMYQALGGFDEAHQIINNDLDFCLRAFQAGKLIVYTPYASLLHHEAASRDGLKDVFDLSQFESRWKGQFAAGDPYFSPWLTRHSDDYHPDDEPVEAVFAGHPMFRHDEIKRILAMKVDHIGDFVTAIPALRRLKQLFPQASIHVLAGRGARAFAEIEDCIDELIEFEFFHAVSGLGPKNISDEEYKSLRARLAPYRFDIAVDLRKHLDTRDLLRFTPARFLAGYDYMGQFPFLDIALEWEGDKNLQRKRSHVTDDLINLVDAIGTAGTKERTELNMTVPVAGPPKFLASSVRALFGKPVVAVHPGVGNAMRQWPPEHFASLVDLLIEKNAVNVVLVGGPEETELTNGVLGQVLHRQSVASLAGKTTLRQLAELLRACALYIGNNSGPKHIAAAMGVPTIGIHSGVVDAIEWGPIGRRAVAVRRNMTCSPCYLARQEDCPRSFACMRGLEPMAVHEIAETFLAHPVPFRAIEPLVERPSVAPVVRATATRPTTAGTKPRRKRRRTVTAVSAE